MIWDSIVWAANAEIQSTSDYAPITWGLLGIIGSLGGILYYDLKRAINTAMTRANSHGHRVRITCENKGCKAEAETRGVLLPEGGDND